MDGQSKLKDVFLLDHRDFSLKERVSYPNGGTSCFYDNGKDAVILDTNICHHKETEPIYSYMLITDKQNHYMHQFQRVFRFNDYNRQEVDSYLYDKSSAGDRSRFPTAHDRQEQLEVSPLEMHFENNFTAVYGMNALNSLEREYSICDDEGNQYFLDYLIHTAEGDCAVEENGVLYHHPQIIGEERYRKQLKKQNTCTQWGIKLYRFSTEDCAFENRIEDDIRAFFGLTSEGFTKNGLKLEREVELYEHQEISLKEIEDRRKKGIRAFLVVLPTASGKSKIVEEDMRNFAEGKQDFRALILVPGTNVQQDWKERIRASLPDLEDKIDVQTYAYMARHFSEKPHDYYRYVVVDEAHHAVAPVLKRVIQYYDSDFTIGLTATDQRPDKHRLETVFGSYATSLTLKDAMQKGVVASANVFRIETNIDLSHVRFNGKDYVNADLEKNIRVTSRNDLIVNVMKEYFSEGKAGDRQGVIFCVNVSHAKEMAKLMNSAGLSAASYTGQTSNAEAVMRDFKEKKIRFLCSCNMISEGWDYPELGILVMARPTLSKVLYLQQIGRGLRKTNEKKNVIVIDVVDEYGAMVKACSMHSIFSNTCYVPFGDITRTDYKQGDMVVVDGLVEQVERIREVDIETFEEKYGNYYSQEQLAREFFVSTGTVTSWIKKEKIIPSVSYPFGSKMLYLFSPSDVEAYRTSLGIKEHSDGTIKEDFFGFLNERDYSMSYKMPFLLSFMRNMNSIGDAEIDQVLEDYTEFYRDRIKRGLPVDRKNCPYTEDTVENQNFMRQSMLTNPFEKFERKRFMYYSKDLKIVSFNHALFSQMNDNDWKIVRDQLEADLNKYYAELGRV